MCGAALSAGLALWGVPAQAETGQTVESNGIAITVPSSWHVEPYPQYALCPAPYPVVHTGLPMRPVYASCPSDAGIRPSPFGVDIGAIEQPVRHSGVNRPLRRIGSLSVAIVFQQFPTGELITAYVPRFDAQVAIAAPTFAQSSRILHTIRPAPVLGPGAE